ncbi:MAG: amylo-alpha-1,6-glucosidase [Erysipelotrichaceae bacterium]
MKFIYGKNDFESIQRGNELTYLLTNGLGGFSSGTLINNLSRSEHSLFTVALYPPNNRTNIVSKIEESIIVNNDIIDFSSQEYVDETKNKNGHQYLINYIQDPLPTFTYFYDGIQLTKTLVYSHLQNSVGIKYQINNRTNKNITLSLKPLYGFIKKETIDFKVDDHFISSDNINIYLNHQADKIIYQTEHINDLFYAYDEIDGRQNIGSGTYLCEYHYQIKAKETREIQFVFALNKDKYDVNQMIADEITRLHKLVTQSNFTHPLAQQLVISSDAFISYRQSTNGKTIIAGYPFFCDWGRDTMIAILGCCLSTKRYDDAKSIFNTFINYLDQGLMPNLFPDEKNLPRYNTVDASLWFIYAVYQYYQQTKDLDYIQNIALKPIEEIIKNYMKGTKYSIYMQDDGLLHAGSDLDQVTWMDVRYENILPTPRHGCPVEVNALWYNSIKTLCYFKQILNQDSSNYEILADKIKKSFNQQFINNQLFSLKDVISNKEDNNQIRPNQIFVTMLDFQILDQKTNKMIVDTVYEHLYTPYGLRSLSKYDKEFKPNYRGSLFERDMSYHQGTVWAFPLGAYYISYLKVNNYTKCAKQQVLTQLEYLIPTLNEGCVGQIAEIFDGLNPTKSCGCFAQAWSVSELLRVFDHLFNK